MVNVDLDVDFPEKIDLTLLDMRYVYVEEERIKSINPIIKKMLREIYWKPDMLERFLQRYGKSLTGSVFGGLWEHYWFQKLLIGKQMNISIYLVPQKKELLLNMTEIEILNVKHSEGFAKITFDLVRNTEKPIPVMFRALQENFPLFESCFLAENKDFAFINHKLSSGFSDGNFVNMVTDKYSKYLNQAKQQLGYI